MTEETNGYAAGYTATYLKSAGAKSLLIRATGDLIAPGDSGKGRLCILTYHRILQSPDPLLPSEPDIEAFRWQMKLLADSFNVLPLHDAIQTLRKNRMPPRAVCISFDDGYRSIHDLALPILKEFGLPATLFTTTAYMDGGNMWNDRILEAVRRLPNGTFDLREFGLSVYALGDLKDRESVLERLNNESKYLPPDARHAVIEQLESLAGGPATADLMLTRDMIATLSREGIEIGGHTVTHPILTNLDDESARREIVENKQTLETITGKPLRLFAYPNGKVGVDFDGRHVRMAKEAGYSAAFTTAIGSATSANDEFQIPRSRPWDATPFRFELRLLRWLAGTGGERNVGLNKAATNKRALLIAYHFPPHSESSGIQRTLSFTKNLGESHWDSLVLSVNPSAYEQKNSAQMANLPPGLVVSRPYSLDSKRHLGFFGKYPEIIALPDRWVTWWLFAVPAGLSLIRRYRPGVIWSTFPIATAHLIGMTLQRLTGLPWIADFRDPMLQDKFPKTRMQRAVYRWIEYQAITRCDKAVFTTQGAMEAYKRRFPTVLHHKFAVIENGYDENSFHSAEVTTVSTDCLPKADGKITLLHSGVLYTEGRDPTAFFGAISALKKQGRVSAASFQVILRAPGDIPHFKALVKTHEVEDIVMIEPLIPYQEALREMLAVDGLVIFQGTPFNTQIPAKVYEYFRARKPIFGLLDPAGETAKVLSSAGFHHVAQMTSIDAIIPVLEDFIRKIKLSEAHIAHDDVVNASSRRHRAKQLAQVFNQVIG